MNYIYCLNTIADKVPPQEFLIFKFGENPAYHLGEGEENILFTKVDAYRLLANNKDKKVMIDYDHASLMHNSPNPAETAKAAGFGYLSLKEDGLYLTNIEWTKPANEKLENGEFQYISPAYMMDKTDSFMEKFINVALTNLPALENNAEILNKRGNVMADKTREQELEAELEAMKLSQKKMAAQFEAVTKAQELSEIKAVIAEAVQLGQVGKAEEAEYAEYGTKYGQEALVKMLSKMPKTLPVSAKTSPVQPRKVDAQASGSEFLDEAIARLSTNRVGQPALIKTEEDKVKFLNKLKNPQKSLKFISAEVYNKLKRGE